MYQETSAQALNDFQEVIGEVDREILKVLHDRGRAGATDEEVECATGRIHSTISANRRHLTERGLVKRTRMRGMNSRGRTCIRWVHRDHWHEATHGGSPDEPVVPKKRQPLFS